MTTRPLYRELAILLGARTDCVRTENRDWQEKHECRISALENAFLPHGSGFDCGCVIDFATSTANKIVIETSYHHTNDQGVHDGWTEHKIIVTPSLTHDFDLRITGRDRNGIKAYMYDVFAAALYEAIEIN